MKKYIAGVLYAVVFVIVVVIAKVQDAWREFFDNDDNWPGAAVVTP